MRMTNDVHLQSNWKAILKLGIKYIHLRAKTHYVLDRIQMCYIKNSVAVLRCMLVNENISEKWTIVSKSYMGTER